jgi:hypothetical protein
MIHVGRVYPRDVLTTEKKTFLVSSVTLRGYDSSSAPHAPPHKSAYPYTLLV